MYIHLEASQSAFRTDGQSLTPKAHSLAIPGEHSRPHFVPFEWIDLLSERTADSAQRHTQDPLTFAFSRLLDSSREQSANEMRSGNIDILEVSAIGFYMSNGQTLVPKHVSKPSTHCECCNQAP